MVGRAGKGLTLVEVNELESEGPTEGGPGQHWLPVELFSTPAGPHRWISGVGTSR